VIDMNARTLLQLIVIGIASLAAAPALGQAAVDIQSASDLLNALETADRDIRTLQADIRYERRMILQGDVQMRWGTLYFQSRSDEANSGQSRRIFAVRFDDLLVGRRKEHDPQDWIFDGEWLIERRPAEKQYIARQIAPPGANFDPLRLGEGPLPIPIGQRADDVLERFSAQLVDSQDGLDDEVGAIHDFVNNTFQLLLTPRAARSEESEFRQVRLWYDRDTLLPRLARTVARGGDVSFVQLINLRTNEPIPADAFDIQPPKFEDHWNVEIKEYRSE